jgi:hypothetical protein
MRGVCPGEYRRSRNSWAATVILVAVFVLMSIAGCAIIKQKSVPEDIAAKEKSLTESINNERDPLELSNYYERRARLRARADNPHINYEGALKDLKTAVGLKPELSKNKDVMDWMAVLGRLAVFNQEAVRLREKNELAERQNRALRGNVEQLEKQDQELRKTIEELQSLELQREQRQQRVR